MKTHTLLILVVGIGLMSGPRALAQLGQNTPRPPGSGGSQSTSSGKPTQSKGISNQAPSNKSAPAKSASKQHQAGKGKHYGDGHSGVGVGVGVNVDLGGIGQRRPEPDPFAVAGPPVPQTQQRVEKPKPKKKELNAVAKADPFADVELTGAQAKGESKP